jgi:hypothetical protein
MQKNDPVPTELTRQLSHFSRCPGQEKEEEEEEEKEED